MTQMTILANGDKGVLASPQHLLLLAMDNAGGWIARGAGASVLQLKALAKHRPALAALTEREGLRVIVTGATLTPAGREHLRRLDEALARQQHVAAVVADGFH